MTSTATRQNFDPGEIDKFSKLASRWWDPNSEFRPLHEINPLRLDFIDERVSLKGKKVLDVGCGTGALLHRAREEGHPGRLCGNDPARGMLEQARQRSDIEWVLGDLASASWEREFDLILMSGHAFQVFLQDDELRTAIATIRSALTEDGRFAFETRNPMVRDWEHWIRNIQVKSPTKPE